MTPDKIKKPLPSSTSFVSPEWPTTYQQWKIALQRVKILYLRGQWKQCTAQCLQLMSGGGSSPQALHATCIHFYCALSHEATARLVHSLSMTKLHLLEQAKNSYRAAAQSLPVVARTDYDYNDTCSSHSTTSTESEILDYYQSSLCSSSPRNKPSSPSSIESVNSLQDPTVVKPSPLRIRKLATDSPQSSFGDKGHHSPFYTPNQLLSTPQRADCPLTLALSRDSSKTFSRPTSSWLHISYYERYTADLASFAEMLSNHTSAVEALIETTQDAQGAKYTRKELRAFGDDELAREADLKARISRLKAAGWRRERFKPERYQELCERALEEL